MRRRFRHKWAHRVRFCWQNPVAKMSSVAKHLPGCWWLQCLTTHTTSAPGTHATPLPPRLHTRCIRCCATSHIASEDPNCFLTRNPILARMPPPCLAPAHEVLSILCHIPHCFWGDCISREICSRHACAPLRPLALSPRKAWIDQPIARRDRPCDRAGSTASAY